MTIRVLVKKTIEGIYTFESVELRIRGPKMGLDSMPALTNFNSCEGFHNKFRVGPACFFFIHYIKKNYAGFHIYWLLLQA